MPEKEEITARVTEQLARAAGLRSSAHADPKAAAARRKLRAWQAERLARTHGDLLASPRFGEAAKFFLTDVYGVNDPGNRDAEVGRVVPMMTKFLSTAGLETAADAIELDALSEDLDAAMVAAIGPRLTSLDAADYGRAYRKVGRRADRERQIELIRHLGQSLDRLTRQRFIAATLAIMRKPAKLVGLGDLQGFLERGFTAFKKMGNADELLALIVTRERNLLDALFAGDDSLLGGKRSPARRKKAV
ncbi:MAG: FFLEELY motif protein [Hyphomicrobiales bacterium]